MLSVMAWSWVCDALDAGVALGALGLAIDEVVVVPVLDELPLAQGAAGFRQVVEARRGAGRSRTCA